VLVLHRKVLSESFPAEDFAALHLKMAAKYVQLKTGAATDLTQS
jgi:hypothetical protein